MVEGSAKHGELVAFVKTEHGMSHGHANAVVAEMSESYRDVGNQLYPPIN